MSDGKEKKEEATVGGGTKAGDVVPLSLGDTLRDLALLRASGVDLVEAIGEGEGDVGVGVEGQSQLRQKESEKDRLVEKSFEFVRETRAALRVVYKDDVGEQGKRIDELREGLEECVAGMDSNSSR